MLWWWWLLVPRPREFSVWVYTDISLAYWLWHSFEPWGRLAFGRWLRDLSNETCNLLFLYGVLIFFILSVEFLKKLLITIISFCFCLQLKKLFKLVRLLVVLRFELRGSGIYRAAFSGLRAAENWGLISETLVCSCGSYGHTNLSTHLYTNIYEVCVCVSVVLGAALNLNPRLKFIYSWKKAKMC